MSRGSKIIDLTGNRYGRLLVTGLSHKKKKSTTSRIGGSLLYWAYKCDCDRDGFASGANLKSGLTKSCGCLSRDKIGDMARTHGMSGHGAYQSWAAMRRRCSDENLPHFVDYGGRGITVCARWQEFSHFWEDMGPTWAEGLTIERKNVNGNYEPDNCVWLPANEQANNTRRSVWLETPWGRMTVADAARKSGVPYEVIRLRHHGGKSGDELFAPAQLQS